MYRIILFLLLIALAAWGAAWVADQSGDVVLAWHGWQVHATLPVFALAFGIAIVAAVVAWSILRALWGLPEKIRKSRRERRHARGRHAITQGLLAIGHGDSAVARAYADVARRHATGDPLTLLLQAQSAQLDGNRDAAREAFQAMATREDTRLLGLRGLFIEAQRADDVVAAVTIAEEALKTSPSSAWAAQAVLGFRCAKGDWIGALAILDNNLASGQIDKETYRRQRGVLLTARALELETADRDQSREVVMEAVSWRRHWCPPRCCQPNSRAKRIRSAAPCASWRRRGWRSRIPIWPMPTPTSNSAIPRVSAWCGSRPWRRRCRVISKAGLRSPGPRSMPPSSARRARRWRRSSKRRRSA